MREIRTLGSEGAGDGQLSSATRQRKEACHRPFWANRPEGNGIFLIDANGGPVELIYSPLDGSAGQPSWSPDGERIAFMANSPTQAIHVMRSDGSDVIRLTDSVVGSNTMPAWSTSGEAIEATVVSSAGWAAIKLLFSLGGESH